MSKKEKEKEKEKKIPTYIQSLSLMDFQRLLSLQVHHQCLGSLLDFDE
jgi:hypothetical protein